MIMQLYNIAVLSANCLMTHEGKLSKRG